MCAAAVSPATCECRAANPEGAGRWQCPDLRSELLPRRAPALAWAGPSSGQKSC